MDDCGNLLISDCCRIISWNQSLQTSRIIIDGIPHLRELVRYKNRILALRNKKRGEAMIEARTWFERAVSRNVAKTRSSNANNFVSGRLYVHPREQKK